MPSVHVATITSARNRNRCEGAADTLWKLQDALRTQGVEFIPEEAGKGPGVRLRQGRDNRVSRSKKPEAKAIAAVALCQVRAKAQSTEASAGLSATWGGGGRDPRGTSQKTQSLEEPLADNQHRCEVARLRFIEGSQHRPRP